MRQKLRLLPLICDKKCPFPESLLETGRIVLTYDDVLFKTLVCEPVGADKLLRLDKLLGLDKLLRPDSLLWLIDYSTTTFLPFTM